MPRTDLSVRGLDWTGQDWLLFEGSVERSLPASRKTPACGEWIRYGMVSSVLAAW